MSRNLRLQHQGETNAHAGHRDAKSTVREHLAAYPARGWRIQPIELKRPAGGTTRRAEVCHTEHGASTIYTPECTAPHDERGCGYGLQI